MVRVNRANYYDAWSKRVVAKLKAGSDVIVVNLQHKSDLDACCKLAGRFSARLTLSDNKTTCLFTFSNEDTKPSPTACAR